MHFKLFKPVLQSVQNNFAFSIRTVSTNKTLFAFNREQLNLYEKDGFLVVRKLVPNEKLDKYKRRFQKICSEKIRLPGMTVMKDVAIAKSEFVEGEKAITKVQDFCFDDELFDYCCLPEIVSYVKTITGPNVMAMHTMLINKPPGSVKKKEIKKLIQFD
jgi:phytanoyl-CoA hydroxylase